MMERKNASVSRKNNVIYNPVEDKWERKLTPQYLGELGDFSLKKEINMKFSEMKKKALSSKNKTRKLVNSEPVKLHMNDLKTLFNYSIEKLKKINDEIFQEQDEIETETYNYEQNYTEENGNNRKAIQDQQQGHERNYDEQSDENYDQEWNDDYDEESDRSEGDKPFALLKIILAIIGLIVAFISN